ncbi:hypothetical protein KY362_02005 [Candidatus Woesearchaeota archaeon]|nr:hypothetical protein [Candidatus Woesearchaeota archaeon]
MVLDYELLRKELRQNGLDLDRLADGRGTPIEDKIKPLLLVLNYLGYKTSASCEGHTIEEHKKRIRDNNGVIIEESPYHYILEKRFGQAKGCIIVSQAPYVDLEINPEQFRRLNSIVRDHNSANTIHWNFQTIETDIRFSPEYTHTLDELQATIPLIANYIFTQHQ